MSGKITIAIPTSGQRSSIFDTLDSINNADTKDVYEVLVIINGKNPRYNLSNRKINYGFRLSIVKIPNSGLHEARNRAITLCKTAFMAFLDDDVLLDESWGKNVVSIFSSNEKTALIGGKCIPYFLEDPPGWLKKIWTRDKSLRLIEHLSLIDLGNDRKDVSPYFIFGCNFIVRKSIVLLAGGFHPDGFPKHLKRFRGDGESYIAKFIDDRKLITVYDPETSVRHVVTPERMTVSYLIQRTADQAISDAYTDYRHKNILKMCRRLISKPVMIFFTYNSIGLEVFKLSAIYLTSYFNQITLYLFNSELKEWVSRSNYLK